jgi:hypothetical protein
MQNDPEPLEDVTHAAAPQPAAPSVLLVHPPVYDTRFPWGKWQQPVSLLRYASTLRGAGDTVAYLDALAGAQGARFRKEKWGQLDLDGQRVDCWRYGRSRSDLLRAMRKLAAQGPSPGRIIVECAATFWWRGVREVVELAAEAYPGVPVEVVGAYAVQAPEHARAVAGAVPTAPPQGTRAAAPDWSVAGTKLPIGYLHTGGGTRTPADLLDDILSGSRHGLTLFAFAEHGLAGDHPELFAAVLREVVARKPRRVTFIATGTVAPAELLAHPHFPKLMREAGFRQIYFADDRDMPAEATGEFLEQCHRAAALCHAAGFRARSDELAAGVCLGRAGEDLDERARFLTEVSHALGSVVVWPYQPELAELPGVDMDVVNGKIFPLRERNGATYRDYLNVLGLATVLNAKYREHTFDFLGDSLMARLFRDSLAREAWDPEEAVKGSLQLPAPRPRLRGAA